MWGNFAGVAPQPFALILSPLGVGCLLISLHLHLPPPSLSPHSHSYSFSVFLSHTHTLTFSLLLPLSLPLSLSLYPSLTLYLSFYFLNKFAIANSNMHEHFFSIIVKDFTEIYKSEIFLFVCDDTKGSLRSNSNLFRVPEKIDIKSNQWEKCCITIIVDRCRFRLEWTQKEVSNSKLLFLTIFLF